MPDEITADDWDAALKEAQEEIEKEMTDELLLGCTGDEIHGEQSLKAKES